ncbi:unnamed protein product [Amoebophrya sp. A120]|nr:unnamed protein product [Amoebophrya sp. A120]|eukprot:GSA120T00016701001.1
MVNFHHFLGAGTVGDSSPFSTFSSFVEHLKTHINEQVEKAQHMIPSGPLGGNNVLEWSYASWQVALYWSMWVIVIALFFLCWLNWVIHTFRRGLKKIFDPLDGNYSFEDYEEEVRARTESVNYDAVQSTMLGGQSTMYKGADQTTYINPRSAPALYTQSFGSTAGAGARGSTMRPQTPAASGRTRGSNATVLAAGDLEEEISQVAYMEETRRKRSQGNASRGETSLKQSFGKMQSSQGGGNASFFATSLLSQNFDQDPVASSFRPGDDFDG